MPCNTGVGDSRVQHLGATTKSLSSSESIEKWNTMRSQKLSQAQLLHEKQKSRKKFKVSYDENEEEDEDEDDDDNDIESPNNHNNHSAC